MQWATFDLSDNEETNSNSAQSSHSGTTILEQNEQKLLVQLKKFQDREKEDIHKSFVASMTSFGDLLVNDNHEEITTTLFTDDCEAFLFNFGEQPPKYALKHDQFISMYNGFKVTQREVRDTYVDLQKSTGFQICDNRVQNEKDQTVMSHYSCEIFSFKDGKIGKYRAIYGCMNFHGQPPEDPFKGSKIEVMRAKVKELNNAWVGQPDFEKIASLLHENVEYKMWRWKDKKGFTFNKSNFASEFKKCLEGDFKIISVVPFDTSLEAQFFVGSYVYNLEGKGEYSGKNYQWMCTCIYTFDKDLNIVKINHQGELYPEGDTLIPFEVFSQEKLKQKTDEFYMFGKDQTVSLFGNNEVHFSFEVSILGPSYSIFTGMIKGFNEYKKFSQVVGNKELDFEIPQPLDIFTNLDDPCYDSSITITCAKGVVRREEYVNQGKIINSFTVQRISFLGGKLAKLAVFVADIPEPIPSPYDDAEFVDENMRPKKEFL